jgi:peptide deformylase
MSFKVLIAPDKTLTQTSEVVTEEEFGENLDLFINQMIEIMNDNSGIGLAAIQIGLKKRIVVANIDGEVVSFVNPKIIESSDALSVMEEGCLSVPTILAEVSRPETVVVRYIDNNYNVVDKELSGLSSHIIQHEIDHLNGKTILRHISRLKRDMYKRKVNKIRKKLKNYFI